ncbi:hypothetical protein GGR51DRAFT_570393 [Nemania sp. FL0031]|nr:hypothetical protein GGR51DRAFT_570393 [Nemania sp. FL0031]
MAPVTEVVLLTLAPGADYGAIIESTKTIAAQPGCLTVRTSRLHDDPDQVHYIIDWDAVESHLAFARNEAVYGPFLQRFGEVALGFAPPYHVGIKPFPPVVFDGGELGGEDKDKDKGEGGVVLVGKAWFPGSAKGEGEEKEREGGEGDGGGEGVEGAFAKLVKMLGDKVVQGFTGSVAQGWSLEKDIAFMGEPSRVFLFAVGWDCIEACERFRRSSDFEEAVAAIEGLSGLRGLEVCVVSVKDKNA